MRIVAHNGARIWGGAERATTMLLRGLSDRGHEVMLLCNADIVASGASTMGVRAELSPIGGDVALPHAFRFARKLRRMSADALIIGTWKKLFLASLGARIAGVPRVVARVGLETDTARSGKYVFALRRMVDGVAVNSERMLPHFEKLPGCGDGKVRLIHNGVRRPVPPDEAGLLRRQLGITSQQFVVGCIARLAKQKRIDRLLDAVAGSGASVHCVIAGDGEEGGSLISRAARDERLAGRVHFLGHREDRGTVLDALDAFVVTSDTEGLSNAMLEAMAAGVPVITTPVSGAIDAITGDDPGGMITGFDVTSIGRAFESLMKDEPQRRRMSAAAQRRAETVFSMERMLDRWEAFLSSAADRR